MNKWNREDTLDIPFGCIEGRIELDRPHAYALIKVVCQAGRFFIAPDAKEQGVVAVMGTNLLQWPSLYWAEPVCLRTGQDITLVPLDACLVPIVTRVLVIGGCDGKAVARTLLWEARNNFHRSETRSES